MPHKYRNSRFRGRQRRRRYQPRYRRKRTVRARPVPASKTVTLKYVDQFTIDPAAGNAGHHLMRANDMFDPDQTGGGHQPMAFDQWMTFYNKFTVTKAKIRATFWSSSIVLATARSVAGIYVNDDNSSSTDILDMLEFRNTTWKPLTNASGSRSLIQITQYYNAKSFFGKKAIVGSVAYSGSASASPSQDVTFDVFLGPIDGTENVAATDILVEIWYTAVLTERKTLAAS